MNVPMIIPFAKIIQPNGNPCWVNANHVEVVEAASNAGGTRLRFSGGHTVVTKDSPEQIMEVLLQALQPVFDH